MEELVGALVRDFLAGEARRRTPPDLAEVLRRLRDGEAALRSRGISRLAVFGSVARGEAGSGSDIDLLADLDPASSLSLVGLASLRAELTELLGAPVDLAERAALRPEIRDGAEREAVRAW